MSERRAGCPGLREVPDVRAGGAGLDALWIDGAGFPGEEAGCPGLGPDVRAEVANLRVSSVVGAGFLG